MYKILKWQEDARFIGMSHEHTIIDLSKILNPWIKKAKESKLKKEKAPPLNKFVRGVVFTFISLI